MAYNVNLCPNGYLTPPAGYPIRLWLGGELMLSGVVPKGAASISVTAKCEMGTANAHLAIFTAPTTSGGNDNGLVAEVDASLNASSQTMTLTIPSSSSTPPVAPATYVVRFWVDTITGSSPGLARAGGLADVVPTG
ncbi:MAG TPA: hypothetical protein VJ891_03605, partial [Casimicrobiaceae bacterium]|nr:hypothetical protein [Casimicrobiaceae bacterium]